MPKLILCCGVSASGKSTWAKSVCNWEQTIEINRDFVRFNVILDGKEDWGLYKFNKTNESIVTEHCTETWEHAVKNDLNVVVSDTNLKQEYHDLWRERALRAGYEFEIKFFPISLEEAWKRDERRSNSVGRDVITKQWGDWLKITGSQKYIPDETLPPCIVVDIDGTLAEQHNRGPFDWSKVGQDKPRQHVIDIIKAYLAAYPSTRLVVVSGRDGVCQPETGQWLLDNDILYDELFMRSSGDMRKDSIVKAEILTNCVAKRYNILFWVDDRPQVVRMLKDVGVNVVDVSKNYAEF
jgi:predicted kinase